MDMLDASAFGGNKSHKEKCEELRKIRVKMADNLGIADKIRQEPCNYKGNCNGTCPACYKEEQIIMERLYELHQNGIIDLVYGDKNAELKIEIDSRENDFLMGEDILEGDIVIPFDEDDKTDDIFGTPDDVVGDISLDKPPITLGGIRPPSTDEGFNPVKTTYSFMNTENSDRLELPPFRPGNVPIPPMSGQILPSPEYFNIRQVENKDNKHGIFGKKKK